MKLKKVWQRFRLPVPPGTTGVEVNRVPARSWMLKHGLEAWDLVAKNPFFISTFMGISPGVRMHPGREHRAEKSVERIRVVGIDLTKGDARSENRPQSPVG